MIHPVPDGSVWDPVTDRAADQLNVYGVPLQVTTWELAAMSRRLDATKESLTEAIAALRQASRTIELTVSQAPDTGRRALSVARGYLAQYNHLARACQELSDDVSTARRDYIEAENAAQRRLLLVANQSGMGGSQSYRLTCQAPDEPPSWWDMLTRLPGLPHRALTVVPRSLASGLWAFLYAKAHGRDQPSDAEIGLMLQSITNAFWWTFGSKPGADSVPDFGKVLNGLATTNISNEVRVRRIPAPPRPRPPGPGFDPFDYKGVHHEGPATNIEGIVERVGAAYPREGDLPAGAVRVDRVEAEDGTVSWQVFVPGTQTNEGGLWGGAVPNDWASNVQMYSGQEAAHSNAVLEAMRQAGIQPGESVMMAGHSQGGIAAAMLASQEDVQAEFSIDSIVTIGSPVGQFDLPPSVNALHLEHEDDLVSGLDNLANPVAPNRTTVMRNINEHEDSRSVRQSHDIPAYRRTAEQADRSTDPSIQAWTSSSLPAHGSQSNSEYYHGERVVP